MDKNRKKSDLLAAGRKKLEQYRQKKENKGVGHGKLLDKVAVSESASPSQVPHTEVASAALPNSKDGKMIKVDAERTHLKVETGLLGVQLEPERDDKLMNKDGEVMHPVEETLVRTAPFCQDPDADVDSAALPVSVVQDAALLVQDAKPMHMGQKEVVHPKEEADSSDFWREQEVTNDYHEEIYDEGLTPVSFARVPLEEEASRLVCQQDFMVDKVRVTTISSGDQEEEIDSPNVQHEQPIDGHHQKVPEGDSTVGCSQTLVGTSVKVGNLEGLLLEEMSSPVLQHNDSSIGPMQEAQFSGLDDKNCTDVDADVHKNNCFITQEEFQRDAGPSEGGEGTNNALLKEDKALAGAMALQLTQEQKHGSLDEAIHGAAMLLEMGQGKTNMALPGEAGSLKMEKDKHGKCWKEEDDQGDATMLIMDEEMKTEYLKEGDLHGNVVFMISSGFVDNNPVDKTMLEGAGFGADSLHRLQEKQGAGIRCMTSETESSENASNSLLEHSDQRGSSVFAADSELVSSVMLCEDGAHDSSYNCCTVDDDILSKIVEELYVNSVMEDVLQVQLQEQSLIQLKSDEQDEQLLNEVSKLRSLLNVAHESSARITEEFAQCRSELMATTAGKKELETQLLSARGKILELEDMTIELQKELELSVKQANQELRYVHDGKEELNAQLCSARERTEEIALQNCDLHSKLEKSDTEVCQLTVDLAKNKELVAVLQARNETLTQDLFSAREQLDVNKLELTLRERTEDDLVSENSKIMAEFPEAGNRQTCLEDDLREAMSYIELLTEENFCLSCSLDIHRAKASGDPYLSSRRCEGSGMLMNHSDDQMKPDHVEQEPGAYSDGFSSLREHLEDAENIMQRLEKCVQGMRSDNSPSVRLPSKAASGVSRIIQAFESKALSEETLVEEVRSIEAPTTEDQSKDEKRAVVNQVQDASSITCVKLARDEIHRLNGVLKQLDVDVGKASHVLIEEQRCKEAALGALRNLEAEHVAKKQESIDLEAQMNALLRSNEENMKRLLGYESLTYDLHVCVDELHQSFLHTADMVIEKVECLQKEVDERMSILELESSFIYAEIFSTVEKLRECTNPVSCLSDEPSDFTVGMRLSTAASAAAEAIDDLHKQLLSSFVEGVVCYHSFEELKHNEVVLLERNQSAILMLDKTYSGIVKMVNTFCDLQHPVEEDLNFEKLQDMLPNLCEILTMQLHNFVSERMLLHSAKVELESELFSKIQEIEEWNQKVCSDRDETWECNNSNGASDAAKPTSLQVSHPQLSEKDVSEGTTELVSRPDEDGHALVNKLIEAIENEVSPEQMVIGMGKHPLEHLEALVFLLLGKYKEITEPFNLLRKCILDFTTRPELFDECSMVSLHVILKEEFELKSLCLGQLEERIHELNSVKVHLEVEIQNLNEGLAKMEANLDAAYSELRHKYAELEQSEQRLASVKEKLSIAVAKGKGLIVQRDTLKQSLAEKTSDLEKCWKELQSKTTALHEAEAKLTVYSEAGERIEALESELSYIRNSATTLRESFLQKDSVLQRIEEILDESELPDHFNSGDVTEKIEWLVRSIPGNPVLMDWDQKSSVGEAGFVASDTWKEDSQANSNPAVDDLRRKYEELQSRFYGLAEQNDMLEQSLMERNDLVQRWEEILDNINMPLNLQSMEPEDRIEWLGKALREAQHDRDAFREKIESLVESSSAFMVDLEESRNKISNLEAALGTATHEKELSSGLLEKLTQEHEQLLEKALRDELDKENFHKEVITLQKMIHEQNATSNEYCSSMEKETAKLQKQIQEQNAAHEKYCIVVEDEIKKLQSLVHDTLLDHDIRVNFSGANYIDSLRECVEMLLDSYTILSLENSALRDKEKQKEMEQTNMLVEEQVMADATVMVETDNEGLKRELEEALFALSLVKGDRDHILEQCESLVIEVQELGKQKENLEEQLSQEEQKSTSVREKLSVAVRKGKALVQQRDQLKQILDESNSDTEKLKIEIQKCNDSLVEYEQKIYQLLRYQEKCGMLESESIVLRSRLEETENTLHSKMSSLNAFLTGMNADSIICEVNSIDPLQKLELLVKVVHDLEARRASCEQDAKKSKQAAELLVAELNDVQDRFENLQDELTEKETVILAISAQRDASEAAKSEALLRLEQATKCILEDRQDQCQKDLKLKIVIEQLNEACDALYGLLANGFSKEFEIFGNVEACLVAFFKKMDPIEVIDFSVVEADCMLSTSKELNEEMFPAYMKLKEYQLEEHHKGHDAPDLFEFAGHGLQTCMKQITWIHNGWLKWISNFSHSSKRLIKIIERGEKGMTNSIESLVSLKRYVSDLEGRKKEKDAELASLHKLIMLLYEACSSSIFEIENQLSSSGHCLAYEVHSLSSSRMHPHKAITVQPTPVYYGKGGTEDEDEFILSAEAVNSMANDLLSAVKDSTKKWFEMVEEGQKELKVTVSCLQEEMQEKEIQRNRICAELVSQIKEAEETANRNLVDLHTAKKKENDLEQKVKMLEHAHEMLLLQVNDLTGWETSSRELQEKVESFSDLLAKKDQEIEGLIQALDEEEVQMDDMAKKVEELEKTVQHNNYAIESLESSRAKAVAKLSSTLRKFDELHHFSENLLSEIENFHVQLQGRDEEISFLRQEVTSYTDDLLTVQENNKRSLTEVHEFSLWLETIVSRLGMQEVNPDDAKNGKIRACMELLDAHIASMVSELEGLRLAARSSDSVLQGERNKLEELLQKVETLENSINEKESQLQLVSGTWESGRLAGASMSEALEVESVGQRNKKVVTLGPVVSHARNIRKVANDHAAIDMEAGSSLSDAEEDDKSHGFKSLTTSSIVPRITRPFADRMDGLWVSGERLLMRQPTLRLGFVIYWVVIHVLFAAAII